MIKATAFYKKKPGRARETEDLHFVFPWAEHGNLRKFWEEKIPSIHDSDYMKWIFDQLVGLADAICSLHHESEQTCRHGDLKPENVLCFNTSVSPAAKDQKSCILVISDVGLARFHDKSTELRAKSRFVAGESRPYAAPETALFPDRPTSRRYDIWSLGCLYLEFIIWLLYGFEGLKAFGSEIESAEGRFYVITVAATLDIDRSKTAQINPVVKKWIEYIKRDKRCTGPGLQQSAISRLVALVEKRLLVVAANPDLQDLNPLPLDPGYEQKPTVKSEEGPSIPRLSVHVPTALGEEAQNTVRSKWAGFANTREDERAYAIELCKSLDGIVQDVRKGVIEWIYPPQDGKGSASYNRPKYVTSAAIPYRRASAGKKQEVSAIF